MQRECESEFYWSAECDASQEKDAENHSSDFAANVKSFY